jgi:sterol desaturase/sphingolipid hydroxylase (fatty acid hydroxylase superfamily)
MNFLNAVFDQIKGFFGFGGLLDILRSGNYGKFLTYDGITALVGPLLPFLLIVEIIRAAFYKRFKVISYKISFFTYVLNAFVGRVIAIAMVGVCIGLFQKYALFQLSFTWYWFIVGYVIWEFSHFIYHYLAHKVRILWCLHSTHHAPEAMNLSVTYAHFFLEGPLSAPVSAFCWVFRRPCCSLLCLSTAPGALLYTWAKIL